MTQPTPYGKSEGLALENQSLKTLVKELKEQRDTARRATVVQTRRVMEMDKTIQELYEARMLYHAHAVRPWMAEGFYTVKSLRHHDGELCFGGGWFIVVTLLPDGQISQHYREEHWDLFQCRAVYSIQTPFDGHTTQDTHQRLRGALGIEEP